MKRIGRLSLLVMSVAAMTMPAQAGLYDSAYFFKYMATYLGGYLRSYFTGPSDYRNNNPYVVPKLISARRIACKISKKIDPQTFTTGVSSSGHQDSSECTAEICSWSRYAKENNLPQMTGKAGEINFYKYYKQYFDFVANIMKLTAFRFSVEWPLVQKKEGEWDIEVLDHYANMYIYGIKNDLALMVCFHHYTDPTWFVDKGAFTKAENISYYKDFCLKVYEHIMNKVAQDPEAINALRKLEQRQPCWISFNSPEGDAFRRYRQKEGPVADPNNTGLRVVAEDIKNKLEAHVQIYYALKQKHKAMKLAKQEIPAPRIGLLKNIHQLDPAKDTWMRWALSPFTRTLTAFPDMIKDGGVYRFFTEGKYQVYIPFAVNIKHENKKAIGALDTIILSHYSSRKMVGTKTVFPSDAELKTDNKVYFRDSTSHYRALVELYERLVKPFEKRGKKLPIVIGENGIAIKSDKKRKQFDLEYLYAMSKAIEQDILVLGNWKWTMATNYEWPSKDPEQNTKRDYGLCSVDQHDSSKLYLKPGAKAFIDFADEMQKLAKVRSVKEKELSSTRTQ